MPTHTIQQEDSFTDLDLVWERRFPTPLTEQEAIEDDIAHWQRIGLYLKNPPKMGYNRKLLIEHTQVGFSAVCAFYGHSRCHSCCLSCMSSSSVYYKIKMCMKKLEFKPNEMLALVIQMIKYLKSELVSIKN